MHYLSAGISGLRCILEVLALADKDLSCGTILDFPSGYGRVLRFVRAKFPEADITGAELDEVAVAFCARNFSTTPLVSMIPITDLKLDRRYDLIWFWFLDNATSNPFHPPSVAASSACSSC